MINKYATAPKKWTTGLDISSHKTIARFMQDNTKVRIIKGPVGSGKSTGGCADIMKRALEQQPAPKDNIRYFKALIVRNTLPEVRKTTLRTWQAMFPPSIGKYNDTHLFHHIIFPETANEAGLDLLVEFMGLDRPIDTRRLLSWEGTMIWFNEAKEIHKEIIDMATYRIGRYPSKKQGGIMPSWSGIIMDTNPYKSGHWLDEIEKDLPPNWSFYIQPPGVLEMVKHFDKWVCIENGIEYEVTDNSLIFPAAGTYWAVNPNAENLHNLPVDTYIDPSGNPLKAGGYYATALTGKDRSSIEIYLQSKNGTLTADMAVIPEFSPTTMIKDYLIFDRNLPLIIGIDFGAGTLNPAAIFGQRDPVHNRWHILRELAFFESSSLIQFADQIFITLQKYFENTTDVQIWGDPAGMIRTGIDQKTYFDHLIARGLYANPAPSNDIGVRIECIKSPMLRFSKGEPSFLISKDCKILIDALAERWCYQRLNVANEVRFDEKPCKIHPYSDVADALGYMLSGGGEHSQITISRMKSNHQQSFKVNTNWNILEN
jgi:hypothetical protein